MDEQTPAERAYSELFHRLPTRPLPADFRRAVMARIAAETARPWEWIVAALLAIPNGAFLVWVAIEHGAEISQTLANLVDALLLPEQWSGETAFYVDGLVLLAVALCGAAAMLVTHALIFSNGTRARVRAA